MPMGLGGFGASTDLGLGDMTTNQREEETDEQRRRRQLLDQMKEAVNPFGASMSLGLLGGGSQNKLMSAASNMMGRFRRYAGG